MTDSAQNQTPEQDQTQIPGISITPDKLFQLIGQNCISLSEAGSLTGYHKDYLGQIARQGGLTAIKIGRNWITHRSSLDDFCKTHSGAYPHRQKKIRRRKIKK